MWSWSRQRLEGLRGVAGADGGPEVVEVGVEVVVGDDEDPLVGVRLVVGVELGDRLEPQGRLAAPLLAEDQGRRGVGRAAEELVPGRVVDRRQAPPLEDRVGLGVLLAERVAGDPVMPQELFGLHPRWAFPKQVLASIRLRLIFAQSRFDGRLVAIRLTAFSPSP